MSAEDLTAPRDTGEQPAGHDPKMRLHTHPAMEEACNVPKSHVIIDRRIFEALVSIHGRYVDPIGGTAGGGTESSATAGHTDEQLVVRPEQVRQARSGCVMSGSIPYRVVARDWVFKSKWVVQDILGGLRRMEESEIVQHPLMGEQDAWAMPPAANSLKGAE